MWTTVLAGSPGFARAIDATTINIAAIPVPADPLAAALDQGPAQVGILALEPATRGRIRLNGTATLNPNGIRVVLAEVFGNCPKYIARRVPGSAHTTGPTPGMPTRATALAPGHADLVHRADTLFVGSLNAERGADASHRGGRPGFLEASPDGTELILPDYSGNRMFQTLGNLAIEPRIGLLIVDWETGRTLQIAGRAGIIYDGPEVAARPRAERIVRIAVDEVLDRPDGFPFALRFVEASKVNPPVRDPA